MNAKVNKALDEVKEKAKAFTTATSGETAEEILSQMRGEDSVSEKLAEELKRYVNSDEYINSIGTSGLLMIARHFANWQKQQMMKKAVDGKLVNEGGETLLVVPSLPIITRGMDDGDKVKIIFIKED